MTKGNDLLLDIEEQMNAIKLSLMVLKLDELYRSPDFLSMDKLDFISELLAPEFKDKTVAMEKLVKELLGDRLLELSRYVILDTINKTLIIDKTAISDAGYTMVTH